MFYHLGCVLLLVLKAFAWSSDISSISKRIVVVGGGAAGYFGAIECANQLKILGRRDCEVIILEATSDTLQKVLISGGGRCNVLHDPSKSPKEITKGYPRGSKELLGSYSSRFGPSETYSWFTSKGIPLKTEADGRVFPQSDSSATIANLLKQTALNLNIKILTDCRVKNIAVVPPVVATSATATFTTSSATSAATLRTIFDVTYDQQPPALSASPMITSNTIAGNDMSPEILSNQITAAATVTTTTTTIRCQNILVATGSSRQGYAMLQQLGHTLKKPVPSLFSFRIPDSNLTSLAGVTCSECEVKLDLPKEFTSNAANKELLRKDIMTSLTQRGPVLVTHQGLSGPAILKISAFAARILAVTEYKCQLVISWLPGWRQADIAELLWKERLSHPTRFVGKTFPFYLFSSRNSAESMSSTPSGVSIGTDADEKTGSPISKRLWEYLVSRAVDNPERRWDTLNKNDVNKLAMQISASRFLINGRGLYKDEFVTCGGISLNEIDFESMQSKIVPGLYLAGEVLDVDGITGGYNFQSAWTSGWLAGNDIARKLTFGVE